MHVQQRHLEAFLFQGLQGVENGVVLKAGGDNVLFPFSRTEAGAGVEGLVVALGAAGGKIDLSCRGSPQTGGNTLAGFFHRLARLLPEAVEARGVAVFFRKPWEHGVKGEAADACGRRIVRVNKHSLVLLYQNLRPVQSYAALEKPTPSKTCMASSPVR